MTVEKKKQVRKKNPSRSSQKATVRESAWKKSMLEWMKTTSRTVWAWSWAVSIFVAGFLGLSLGTYDKADPSYFVSTSAAPNNFCALAGSWTADAMFQTFGFSAWWFVLGAGMTAVFALRAMWRRYNGETDPRRLNPPKFSAAFGFIALLLGSTCLEATQFRRYEFYLPGDAGGILGSSFANGLEPIIGIGLSTIVFLVLIAIGLSLLMDFQWSDVCESVGRSIVRCLINPIALMIENLRGRREEEEEPVVPIESPEIGNGELTAGKLRIVKHDTQEHSNKKEGRKKEKIAADEMHGDPLYQTFVRDELSDDFKLDIDVLDEVQDVSEETDEESLAMTSRLIVAKLKSFHIDATVKGVQTGPVITQYWLEPGTGVKGSQIENAKEDLRRALGVQAVRFVPSIPGTSYIGLEVPNASRETVRLKEVLESDEYEKSRAPLTLALGKDIAGKPFTVDLAKMPHLLVAGTTGSGKSVGINAMILSMLFRNDPENLRLVLVDPKMLEFSPYNGIPHLLCPVVTDMNKAATALKWLTREMDRRYQVMSAVGVRHFNTYNEKIREAASKGEPLTLPAKDGQPEELKTWPFIVCIIDELADLMLTNRKEVEGEITRLTQKARAAGIHLIIATQRPSVDVVTSLIKANVPTRLAFQVASAVDSRVILGESGAESLLGWGDMLLHRPGMQQATRIQGCFVADNEVLRVVEELKKYGPPQYELGVTESPAEESDGVTGGRQAGESDPLYDKAVALVLSERRPSISFIQRHLGIGYNRAATIIEAMEAAQIVSAPNKVGKREILVEDR